MKCDNCMHYNPPTAIDMMLIILKTSKENKPDMTIDDYLAKFCKHRVPISIEGCPAFDQITLEKIHDTYTPTTEPKWYYFWTWFK